MEMTPPNLTLLSPLNRTTILLADIGDFAKVNAVYAKYFTEMPPARATFAVKDLPLGARVEIEATAVL
jgi:2-iminobutanoate/2-iminopropanoate deaminase